MIRYITWQDGPVYVAMMYDHRVRVWPRPGWIVQNDGVLWTATAVGDADAEANRHSKMMSGKTWELATILPVEWRLPCEWARRTATERGRVYSRPAPADSGAAPRSRRDPTQPPITYLSFGRYAARSAHSMAELHSVIDEALSHCVATWGWNAVIKLEVAFHDSAKSLGLAYESGSGPARGGVRRISLNVRLLAEYDAVSIRRVVLHELCHHWREESFPKTHNPHDSTFCGELKRVDPLVTPSNRCQFFEGAPDQVLHAEVIARREKGVVWTPAAGNVDVLIRRRRLAIAWTPTPGFRWRSRMEPLNDTILAGLLKRFAPADWERVHVGQVPISLARALGPAPWTLHKLASVIVATYPKATTKTAQILSERSTS